MPAKTRKAKVPESSRIISLLPDFERDMKAGPRWSQKPTAPSTRDKYLKGVRYFCRWLSPTEHEENCVTTVRGVSREIISSYFAELHEKYARNTVMNQHIALSAFFHFCIDYEELEIGESPMRWVRCPNPEIKPVEILTNEEIRKLLATCSTRSFIDKRDYAILRVFLSTGMRLGELQSLLLTDVNLNEGTIEIRRGKGGKPRTVGYGPQVARALGQYIHLRERHKHTKLQDLWIGRQGRLSSPSALREMVYARARQAGIEHVHPHQFRHWFAHGFLEGEGQEHDLQQLAGWANSRMLERYGASRQRERALANAKRIGVGENF